MTDREKLLRKLELLSVTWNSSDDQGLILDNIVSLLELQIREHPHDEEMLIKLALAVSTPPLADLEWALYLLERAFSFNPSSGLILLMIASMQSSSWGISPAIFRRLRSIQSINDDERALFLYMQAVHFNSIEDEQSYVHTLHESILASRKHVWPFFYLGEVYARRDDEEKSCFFYKMALDNVVSQRDFSYILNPHDFIEEEVSGRQLSTMNYERIKDRFDSCKRESYE